MPEYLHKKHFTLVDAREALPFAVKAVEHIVELKNRLEERGYDIYRHQYFGGSGPNGERYFPPELEQLVESAKALENNGIIVKGLEEGLIDFPHIRSNGEEVYLCWKFGETSIYFWHRIPDGFTGRRGLEEL